MKLSWLIIGRAQARKGASPFIVQGSLFSLPLPHRKEQLFWKARSHFEEILDCVMNDSKESQRDLGKRPSL